MDEALGLICKAKKDLPNELLIKELRKKASNKRIQTDQPTRYARGLAADAERYKSSILSRRHLM